MTTQELVVFQQMVEGLFVRGLREDLNADSRQALKEVGLDLSKPLLPAYSIAVWEKCLRVACNYIFPKLSESDALIQLGEKFTQGFAETLVGKALGQLTRVIGIQRSMKRLTQSFRSSNNFMDATAGEAGPSSYRITISNVHHQPGFTQGLLLGGARFMGLKEPEVLVESTEGVGCVYLLKWTPK